jgi:hypothetical protein
MICDSPNTNCIEVHLEGQSLHLPPLAAPNTKRGLKRLLQCDGGSLNRHVFEVCGCILVFFPKSTLYVIV